jgi:hypothetical protein
VLVKKVELFLGRIPCSCAGGLTPAKQEKVTRAIALKSALEREHKDGFDLHVFDLGNEAEFEEGLRLLTLRLENTDESDRAQGAAYALKDLTPSVAVDGRLEWIGEAPGIEEFKQRLA